ncbi:hypothetical protein TVAG_486680 [Trichomonas vaginalis G3]|uniref:Uncharacterized protein n=1 Tax=Trichomonas vaginalis (strain ATCC PRA-98 / G3) TaxID=412133 RepID=A2DZ96_TRIV3|nr:protein ubiquitination [Trichomonas vaginalis G3]EAY14225.1 hypothetical protein TVAG_486680 [Trichomonas vaginalis G3]KAI5491833.1 protein ubiquitination [Trichomonas vaginalis G3]|eukprot:XP_001326448.1 hypothetical protein [Trichomonas vaginalis G3]
MESELDALMGYKNPELLTNSNFQIDLKLPQSDIQNYKFLLPKQGLSLLHIAAFADSLECFIYLFKNVGIPLTKPSTNGYTPIHYAVQGNSLEVLSFYLAYSNIKYDIDFQNIFESEYKSSSDINLPYIAIATKSIHSLSILKKIGYSISKLFQNSVYCLTNLVNLALDVEDIDCLEWILNNAGIEDEEEINSLQKAISLDFDDAFYFLFSKNKENALIKNNSNQNALEIACRKQKTKIVEKIVRSIDNIDTPKDVKATCAVHWLCESQNLEIAKLILEKKIDVNRYDDNNRLGPYYMINPRNENLCLEILKLLVQNGLEIDGHAENKRTILGEYVMSIKKSPKIIEYLIDIGASLDTYVTPERTIKEQLLITSQRNPAIKKIIDKYPSKFK